MTAIAQPLQFPNPGGVVSMTPSIGVPGTSSSQGGQLASAPAVQTQPFQPYYLRPAYRFKVNAQSGAADVMSDGPGRRLRKNVANVRRHIDYIANVLNHVGNRLWQYGPRDRLAMQADVLYHSFTLPPSSTQDKPVDCVLTKFVRAAMNKVKCPIYSICWTPEGKRLITGASTGEFTLWNGTAFNFETILQAHDSAIRALKWSHNDQWLVSADHDGFVKYWQPNMNNVHMYQAHKDEPIRSLSFCPSDGKLVTGSDDGTARIWDFARCAEERILRGHGSDVRSVDWHPHKGLICTGSRDSQQPVKLWDPKSAQCLATLHDHKNSVMSVQWNKNGNWLLTGSRDHLVKMYDIRMMREMHSYRGHKKEVTAVAWHPVHESLFVSGGGDGSLAYWLVNSEKELSFLEHAHDQAIWTLEWHPLGHILASGSNDNNTKFWARNRPGDTQDDIYGLSTSSSIQMHAVARDTRIADADSDTARIAVIPGMGLDEDVYEGMQRRDANNMNLLNANHTNNMSGPLLFPDDPNARQQTASIGAKKTLIKQPPPKKAQRQFERMWNVAKPAGGGGVVDDLDEGVDDGGFRRPKTSLLGPPPPSMLSVKPPETESPFTPKPTHPPAKPRTGSPQVSGGVMPPWQMGGGGIQGPSNKNPPPNGAQMRPSPVITQELMPPSMQQHMHMPPLPFAQPTTTGQLMWPPPLGVAVPVNLDRDYRMGPAFQMPPLIIPSAGTSSDIDLRSEQQPSSSTNSWRPHASPPLAVDKRENTQAAMRDPRRRPTPTQNTKETRPSDNANCEQPEKAVKRSTWMPDMSSNNERRLLEDRSCAVVPSVPGGEKPPPYSPVSIPHYPPPPHRPPPPQYAPVSVADTNLSYPPPEINSPYGSGPGRNSPYGPELNPFGGGPDHNLPPYGGGPDHNLPPYGGGPDHNSPYGSGPGRNSPYGGGATINYAQRFPFNSAEGFYQQEGGGAMRRTGPLIDRRGRGRGRGRRGGY